MASEASWQTGAASSAGANHADAPLDQRGVESLLLKLVERVSESERRYIDALDDLHKRLDRLSQTAAGATRASTAQDSETLERLHRQINRLGRRLDRDPEESLDDFERLGRTLSEGMANAARSAAYYEERDFDRRLVETAQRLERSIGNVMPVNAVETLNARLDDISSQLVLALRQVPQRESLQQVERQISDMGRQLVRAERQLAKVGVIESQLLKLIERFDEKAAQEPPPIDLDQLTEIAQKAAEDSTRRAMKEEKPSTAERLDAMQRDIVAIGDKNKQSNEVLASKIQAVQDSLRRLAEKMERDASAFLAKSRSTFLASKPAADEKFVLPRQSSTKVAESAGDSHNEPGKDTPFSSRSKRVAREDKSAETEVKSEPEVETPEDLIAAARRGTRVAALRDAAQSRLATDIEKPPHRLRTLLIICAATLLILSAGMLLYERLRLRPAPVNIPPAVEQTVPAPATPAPRAETDGPSQADTSSAILELERPESWRPLPAEGTPHTDRVGDANGTEIAKTTQLVSTEPDVGSSLQSQFAALQTGKMAILPGMTFTLDGASLGGKVMDAANTLPATLPLPPETLGPLAMRQAASMGDAKAQYAIAERYAHGKGAPRNMGEAKRWLERSASYGYALAQYRLGTIYERGYGVDKDIARARSWYEAAAEKGNVKAMHNLAIGASGRDNDQADYEFSAKWHEEAASYGFTDSQFNLGILYEHGLGRPKDLAEAYKWFALAALNHDAEAAKQRARLEAELDTASLSRAVQAVKAWKAKKLIEEANDASGTAEWGTPSLSPNAELVVRAQALLNQLGYDAGVPDGVMGARTRDAIRHFESRNGLEETGEVSVQLVTTLESLAG
ncbi:MAG: hypothetical protein FJX44_10065 [Alphaproteobacteria bacterium]|nr:hypothetical protein [Alphaproteobacteria bacterium]